VPERSARQRPMRAQAREERASRARSRRAGLAPLEVDRDAGFHYEFSNEFYQLWLDPSMTYSCAYFEHEDETLEQAQMAKLDLAFRKVGLKAGHRLLDVGCGWGAAAARAVERYGASAVGLTLSRNQHEYARRRVEPGKGLEYRLQGWEAFAEPCDRIVSFGAFEHFTVPKYAAFFGRCRDLLPPDGRLLVQTITVGKPSRSFELLRFAYFLYTELFQTAELPRPEQVIGPAREAGLELLHAETLRPHYVRTIEAWLTNLQANREAAIQATSPELYEKFLIYLNGSARYYRSGETNVYQFLFGVA
jgi:cyclopropane-fatty-acyl-phospholipid synthase